MKALVAILFSCASFPLFADDAEDPVAAEWEKLRDEWKAVAVEIQGQEVDEAEVPEISFEILDNNSVSAVTPDGNVVADMVLDLEHDPYRFDIHHTAGVFDNQNQYGIYRWDEEKLVMCITSPGSNSVDRPQRFETRNTQNLTITFEKQ